MAKLLTHRFCGHKPLIHPSEHPKRKQKLFFRIRTQHRIAWQRTYSGPLIKSTNRSISSHMLFIPPLLPNFQFKWNSPRLALDFDPKLYILAGNAKVTNIVNKYIRRESSHQQNNQISEKNDREVAPRHSQSWLSAVGDRFLAMRYGKWDSSAPNKI